MFLSTTENFEPISVWIWRLSQLFYSVLLELPLTIIQNYSIYFSCFSFHIVLNDYLNSNLINSLFLFSQAAIYPFVFISITTFFHFYNFYFVSIKNTLILVSSEHSAIFKSTLLLYLLWVYLFFLYNLGFLSVHCNFWGCTFYVSFSFSRLIHPLKHFYSFLTPH